MVAFGSGESLRILPKFHLMIPKMKNPSVGKPLGFMAGHVDDFHRAGDVSDERWLKIRASIDSMYKWGQLKKNEYRHAGTDLSMKTDPIYGRCLVVDQSYYIEMLEDCRLTLKGSLCPLL
jgi:hypothetical protein